ncbi:ribbon-helix-helix domain-containing protein [Peptostreptococcus equinus]|uniref:Ribbon-helix-helix domain-containing protein n=1 Tax=Peptostreptococcus equinus TaxID=3003601 RepID=A0ABY7JQU0_9FIRM|nr:ribbon-helix-helix domain-containing protein [Peptostreptococcus sp. CBA3647]WAW15246.1 ribbon-helix-helix domain-containing protein [Peptostreptococcus sp. CBA3647]
MDNITTRIPIDINENLEKVSQQTGIPKSSLILYAINDCLRLRKDIDMPKFDFSNEDFVRFTLRMPEHLKKELAITASERNTSINSLIVAYVDLFDLLYWDCYR